MYDIDIVLGNFGAYTNPPIAFTKRGVQRVMGRALLDMTKQHNCKGKITVYKTRRVGKNEKLFTLNINRGEQHVCKNN